MHHQEGAKNKVFLMIIFPMISMFIRIRPVSSFQANALRSSSHNLHLIKYRCFHPTSRLNLNRFLFDVSEIITEENSCAGLVDDGNDDSAVPIVILPTDDYRTVHAAKTLGLHNGDTLRAGIVNGGITDSAMVQWMADGKDGPSMGKPPGPLKISLCNLCDAEATFAEESKVSLMLALPRPLALSRILPMVAQMGVNELILTTAQKVPKDYFGSHLFRKPEELRRHLVEGLCQAGDVRLPKITVVRRLKPFLEDELDKMFPRHAVARVIAHPLRKDTTQSLPLRFRDVAFPDQNNKKVLVAVGPEGGWAEDYELDLFIKEHGFQQITLGARTLRSDVAVVSLLGLAQDACI
mmetsp:Transcript_23992/g.36970  ORF Transcript_23992/g.36970 Transcript_23992/m.36970 type:complete len:351 (-) Transcript_23992:36-1088(-)